MQSFSEFVKANKNNPKRSIIVEDNDREVLAIALAKIPERRTALETKKSKWEEEKKNLLQGIKYHIEQMQMRLGKLEAGLDYTADIQFELDGIKEIFSKIVDGDNVIKDEENNIDMDEDDIKSEMKPPMKLSV